MLWTRYSALSSALHTREVPCEQNLVLLRAERLFLPFILKVITIQYIRRCFSPHFLSGMCWGRSQPLWNQSLVQGLSHAAFSSFSHSQSLFIALQLAGNLLQGKWKVRAEAQVGVTQKVKVFIQCCAHIYD